jgi:hypothetical protein
LPVIPSSPYQTGAQLLSLVQDLCGDKQGQLFNATFVLEEVNAAARWVARELRNQGKMTLVQDEYLVTIPKVLISDPAQQVYLTFTGVSSTKNLIAGANTPTLPQNMIEPLLLWERPTPGTGTTTQRPVEMKNRTGQGGLEKRMQRQDLYEWEWRTDMVCFVGALVSVDVVMRFSATPIGFVLSADATTITGSLADLDALDCVANRAASQLLPKQGGAALGLKYEGVAAELLTQLATDVTRQQQFSPVRMRPYGNHMRGRGSRLL